MGACAPLGPKFCQIIAQCVALQAITRVKQQTIGRSLAQRLDHGGAADQAKVGTAAALAGVIIGQKAHVQIGGLQNAQMHSTGGHMKL